MRTKSAFFFSLSVLLLQGCVANGICEKGQFTTPAIQRSWEQSPKTDRGVSKTGQIGPGFDYLVLLPEIRKGETYRLILALHGAGDTMENYLEVWKSAALRGETIVAVPQITATNAFVKKSQNPELYFDFVRDLEHRYPIDPARVYVAGVSMGGGAATLLVQNNPHFWRGGILISTFGFLECFPGQAIQTVNNFSDFPPLLYVHGMKDAKLYEGVLNGLDFLISRGVQVQFQSYENEGHGHRPEWNGRIFKWMDQLESQRLKSGSHTE